MDSTIAERLERLHVEQMKGERQLDALERQRQETRDTLLRISGAIQVLEELMASPQQVEAAPNTE